MSVAIAETEKFRIVSSDGVTREFSLALDTLVGQPWLTVRLYANGSLVAEPIRFKMTDSGHRIAAEFPGCDPAYVVVDENGHITNG